MNNRKFAKENNIKANQFIYAKEVRLVGDNVTQGIYTIQEALRIANQQELDLVEISKGDVPICRVVDLSKYLYEQKKKDKDQKRKRKIMEIQIKEIQLSCHIDEHDFNFKLNHAKEFLNDGDTVLVSIKFKGREIVHKDFAIDLIKRFTEEIEDYGTPEYLPKLEGKKMHIRFRSKKKKTL